MPAQESLTPIALALGRVPTGLYLVTAASPEGPVGFVGSFLMQVGFAPPTLCVAVGRSRAHLAAIRAASHFGVSVLDRSSGDVMKRFFRRYAPGESPWDGLAVAQAAGGCPVLDQALAWLACRRTGEFDAGDHVVVFGEVAEARLCRDGDPSIHLRRNGLAY
jgi:flavin reductase (DIM6/NTAB) family NADH-FMN oxidoreductase RutF